MTLRLSGSVSLCLSHGGFIACHWPSIVLGTLREGAPVTIAVVSTALGLHLDVDAVKIN